jgi:hypothetical protein
MAPKKIKDEKANIMRDLKSRKFFYCSKGRKKHALISRLKWFIKFVVAFFIIYSFEMREHARTAATSEAFYGFPRVLDFLRSKSNLLKVSFIYIPLHPLAAKHSTIDSTNNINPLIHENPFSLERFSSLTHRYCSFALSHVRGH